MSRDDVAYLEAEHAARGGPVVLLEDSATVASLPSWLTPVVSSARSVSVDDLTRYPPPATGGRASSVLILFGEDGGGGDVLLIERAHDMRSHSGQPAFPGGAVDADDTGVVSAALREAVEETGVDVDGVRPFAVLPDLYLPPSGFVVSPVLAWWERPSQVSVVDPREVASVLRVAWSDLVDVRRRLRVRHPSGFVGPGFRVDGPTGELVVWGFTAGLLDRIIALAGWEQQWDGSIVIDLDESLPTDESNGAS